jgi:hypothetical protein
MQTEEQWWANNYKSYTQFYYEMCELKHNRDFEPPAGRAKLSHDFEYHKWHCEKELKQWLSLPHDSIRDGINAQITNLMKKNYFFQEAYFDIKDKYFALLDELEELKRKEDI